MESGFENEIKPYKDLQEGEGYIIREFDETIDPIELLWHRDDEDRLVEVVGETDWKIQLEDKLPEPMTEPIFIKRHQWHRVIKGTGTLVLKINK